MTSASPPSNRAQPRVEIGIDARVELLSIVFNLAGAEEYRKGRIPEYEKAVDLYFGELKTHEAIKQVGRLRRSHYISHDAVVKLAVHVTDARTLLESVPFDQVDTLGARWQAEPARVFLTALRSFSAETRFEEFLRQQQPLIAETNRRLRQQIDEEDLLWLDQYFGVVSHTLHVIPGLLTGRASYGASVIAGDDIDRFAIVGVESVDDSGLPVFDRSIVEAAVHELCHSYVRPLLDRYAADFEVPAQRLYRLQEPRMNAQGYRNPFTVINETLTRACTNRFLHAKGRPEEAEKDFVYNRSRGFLWIEEVSSFLERFEADRKQYPTLLDFGAELVHFFTELTAALPDSDLELDERRPQVLKLLPMNESIGVDPDLEAIVVTFDRPMRTDGWSVVGGGPKYPKTAEPSFSADGRIFRLPVELEPSRDYELWLNRGPYQSFASREGVPLEPFRITFRTGSGS